MNWLSFGTWIIQLLIIAIILIIIAALATATLETIKDRRKPATHTDPTTSEQTYALPLPIDEIVNAAIYGLTLDNVPVATWWGSLGDSRRNKIKRDLAGKIIDRLNVIARDRLGDHGGVITMTQRIDGQEWSS